MKGEIFISDFRDEPTTKLWEKVSGNVDLSTTLYIAPTKRKINSAREELIKTIKFSFLPPKLTTVQDYARQFYNNLHKKIIISESQAKILLLEILNKNKDSLAPLVQKDVPLIYPGTIDAIYTFFRDIKQFRGKVGLDELLPIVADFKSEIIKERTLKLLEVYQIYENLLEEMGLIDEWGVMSEVIELLDRYPPRISNLLIDGIYNLSRLEEEFLKKLLSFSENVYAVVYDDTFFDVFSEEYRLSTKFLDFLNRNGNFRLSYLSKPGPNKKSLKVYPTLEDEIRGVGRKIKELCLNGVNPSEISVIFPNPYKYLPALKRIFGSYGICFRMFLGEKLSVQPSIVSLRLLLELISENYPRGKLVELVTSPYFSCFTKESRSWIDTLSKLALIVKGESEWLDIEDRLKKYSKNEYKDFESVLPKVKKDIEDLFSACMEFKPSTIAEYNQRLMEMLRKLSWCKDFNEGWDMEVKENLFRLLRKLSQISELFGKKKLSFREYINFLFFMFERELVFPEQPPIGVNVLGILESRGIASKYIFFLGLIDGDEPKRSDWILLPSQTRERLGLPNYNMEVNVEKFHFERIISSADEVFLSYPAQEEDRLLVPSVFIPPGIKKDYEPEGVVICSEEERGCFEGKTKKKVWEFPNISSEIESSKEIREFLHNEFGYGRVFSVTDLEQFANCSNRYYFEKVLGLKIIEEPSYEIIPREWGVFVHAIMRMVFEKGIKSLNGFKESFFKSLNEVLKHYLPFWREYANDFFSSVIEKIVEIERGIRSDGFLPKWLERKVEKVLDRKLRLKGTIDRADSCDGKILIIDYKTGKAEISKSAVEKGLHLQLPLYAALLEKETGLKVIDGYIYRITNDEVVLESLGKRINLYDAISIAKEKATEYIGEIRDGKFGTRFPDARFCRGCQFNCVCSYERK